MKAAVLESYGMPVYRDFTSPEPVDGAKLVDVKAATLNAVDMAIASGTHYLSPRALPVVAGIEGAGVSEDRRRVYFGFSTPPYGAMADRTLVPERFVTEIPDAIGFEVAATLGNAGMAALMPLSHTAALRPGETVVILGASGVVGRLAVQAAALLGAGRIVAVARGGESLDATRDLGATAVVASRGCSRDELAMQLRAHGGVDVVLDYTWGELALAALEAGNPGVRLVQIGERAGADAPVPAQLLREKGARITGFMPIHAGADAMAESYARLLGWAAAGTLHVEYETYPLEDVAAAWAAAPLSRRKLVLVP
ncbi:zinc-binding dehydrogenase [Rhodococcus sp. HNM0569]|uniref:quinone oxidoreductase family protein n=1 Tax=Rhodococcus sp. HNM0569 TaxID=2716340 RepID=UPI00146E3EAB|nr:zinc-binding dehydrogenase [Rhodococcus sp. HNM0569]NLU84211.1 zinc-binding dehydrogenase [Rhodococcus sp. HNM0569]